MPFKSLAQERWAHTVTGRKALGNKLPEWDSLSKGLKLPARAGPKKPKMPGGIRKMGGILGK